MSLQIGIVGLPNVGKSTLFNALTKAGATASNYPFCTIEPNVGVVAVPDERLDKLAQLSNSKKITATTVEFVDIAGLVKGASKGEGLGNQFLAKIREVSAVMHVVRFFENENIVHVHGRVDPADDLEIIELELKLADLQSTERVKQKKGQQTLEDAIPLLAHKPSFIVANMSEEQFKKQKDQPVMIGNQQAIPICAEIEAEIASLPATEQADYLQAMAIRKPALHKVIQEGYSLLKLISFLTSGPEETRAWTVNHGATAPQAAGKIHSDMQRGFIKAEVITYSDLLKCGGFAEAIAKGKLRIEGKDYLMQDGDVVHFKFNV